MRISDWSSTCALPIFGDFGGLDRRRSLHAILKVPLAFEDGEIERRADRACLQRDGPGVGGLRCRRLSSGGFFARIAEHDLEESVSRTRADGPTPCRTLKCKGEIARAGSGDAAHICRSSQESEER